jgi:UDP-N-acetylglucosamine 2-epimerase (non-hydrolysing)
MFVVGNPIFEVLQAYQDHIDRSTILSTLGLKEKGYFLVTLHRAENVDSENRLRGFLDTLERLGQEYRLPVICSLHPRTRSKMEKYGMPSEGGVIRYLTPLGFFDFVALEKQAFCVLSDSGTVQEECAIFGIPNVTLRDVTERPETMECGSNAIAGGSSESIRRLVQWVAGKPAHWNPPTEYLDANVSDKVVNLLLSYSISLSTVRW